MSNIFLFTGEERYLLDKELQRWRDGFVQKFGAETVFLYGPENFDPSSMMQNILWGWLFVTKKLIIIKHIPTDGLQKIPAKAQEDFVESFTKQFANISPDILIAFVSYKPDKRTKLYKFLEKSAQVKAFTSLSDTQRKVHIKNRTTTLSWEANAMEYFLAQVWPDLYRLESEADKLVTRAHKHAITTITKAHIDTVVFGQVQANTFALFDHMFVNVDKALALIDNMREEWTDRNQAIGAMYRGIILFIMMVDRYRNGDRDARTMSQAIGYAPFAVSKQFGRIQTFLAREKDIVAIYQWLVTLDASIKTGRLPAEAFWIRSKNLFYKYGTWNTQSSS